MRTKTFFPGLTWHQGTHLLNKIWQNFLTQCHRIYLFISRELLLLTGCHISMMIWVYLWFIRWWLIYLTQVNHNLHHCQYPLQEVTQMLYYYFIIINILNVVNHICVLFGNVKVYTPSLIRLMARQVTTQEKWFHFTFALYIERRNSICL